MDELFRPGGLSTVFDFDKSRRRVLLNKFHDRSRRDYWKLIDIYIENKGRINTAELEWNGSGMGRKKNGEFVRGRGTTLNGVPIGSRRSASIRQTVIHHFSFSLVNSSILHSTSRSSTESNYHAVSFLERRLHSTTVYTYLLSTR